jgi:uncharacterized membrane protein
MIVLAAIALAVGAIELDSALGDDLGSRYPRLFGAGAEGSRQLLSAIASSTITVAGVVFSITIVTLSLAAAQYSPRILRNFMRDRANQVVLGVFVGVFVYCVLVLRTIRSGEDAFVPGFSVLLGIALALTGIAFLIFFIHHTATSIQVSEMAARISAETLKAIRSECADGEPYEPLLREPEGAAARRALVTSTETGYIQRMDTAALRSWAGEQRRSVWVEKAAGEFVAAGECLVRVEGADAVAEAASAALRKAFTLNTYRDLPQDPAFGLQQLVEIALKALSPGVNDTGTARDALNYITAIMAELAREPPPAFRVCRDDSGPLVVVRTRGFAELVELAFGALRRNARCNFDVTRHLLLALELLAHTTADSNMRQVIMNEIAAVDEGFDRQSVTSAETLAISALVARARGHADAPVLRA